MDFVSDFYKIPAYKEAFFFFSFNRSFNGIYEMLYYNHKVRFPKRFLFLKANLSSESDLDLPIYGFSSEKNHVFWDF
jgi:hypothetical protein